jgi:iron complex outermembrane receptor protein
MSKAMHHRGPLLAGLSAAIALALYGSAGVVHAQDEQTDEARSAEELDTVVVTYRASLQAAIDLKRDTVGQVDAIVAEDIGKFPDLNLAESLQRVPGVSIARDAGEGRNISVRGLGPDFTRIRINGMEALSTTGGTDSSGGANRGRGFDFNIFASELFNNIIVRKTAAASIEEGSLGATVDLNVARPFDFDGFTYVAAGQMGYNDLSESFDPRASALITDTWADGTFGALFSVAYSEREIIEEGHSTVRWDNGTSSGGFNPASPYTPALQSSTFHPRLPRYGVLGHEQERLGLTGSLQWDASDATRFTLDMLYGNYEATRTEDFLESVSFSRTGANGKPATIVRDGVVDGRGNLVYGLFDNVDVRSESRYDELDTTFSQVGLNFEHMFSDTFRVNSLIGHSKSEFDNPIQTTITMDRADADGYSWDYRGNDRLPLISNGFNVLDPAQWAFAQGLSEIRLRPQTADNTFTTASFDAEWDINDNFSLTGGVLWKEYEFETTERRRASETAVPGLPAGMTLADLTRIMSLYDLAVPRGTDTSWLAPDLQRFADALGIYSNTGIFALSDQVASVRGNNRSVTEDDLGFFLQLDIDTAIGDVPIRGNVGVRYVETDQSVTGVSVVGTTQQQVTVDRTYSDTLPSLNLVAEITPDVLVRFGAAEVMARPGLGNLTPGVSVSVSGGARTVTGGNPLLDPFRATTADLGLEWYFAPESLLSLAYFYKDIDSFVQTTRETRPYNTSGLPDFLLIGTGASPTDDFQFNIPVNTPGGPLRGFEISYQQPFTFMPGVLSDAGMILNYTYVDSEIQYLTAAGANSLNTDLVGLSKNAYNATLYYERDRFGIRVSAAYRDDYLTTVPGRNNADVEGTKASTFIDLSASWNLNEHWQLTFEGLNLTDEFNDQWVDSIGDRASVYHHTGRQYFVGFRYRN